jgi:hypothetical protein
MTIEMSDVTKILLKGALNTITLPLLISCVYPVILRMVLEFSYQNDEYNTPLIMIMISSVYRIIPTITDLISYLKGEYDTQHIMVL